VIPLIPQDIVKGTAAAFGCGPELVFISGRSKRVRLRRDVAYTLLVDDAGMSGNEAREFLCTLSSPREETADPVFLVHLATARRFARLHAERRWRLLEEILAS
jgi:hypothetical protein